MFFIENKTHKIRS